MAVVAAVYCKNDWPACQGGQGRLRQFGRPRHDGRGELPGKPRLSQMGSKNSAHCSGHMAVRSGGGPGIWYEVILGSAYAVAAERIHRVASWIIQVPGG